MASVILCCASHNLKGISQVIPLPMGKNKILIASKLIGSLILSSSVNECWFVVCKQKIRGVTCFLYSLDKSKLSLHWSYAHLTIISQIYDRPSTNIYLETHKKIFNTWPVPVHTVRNMSITGMCKPPWLCRLKGCLLHSLSVVVSSELKAAVCLPFCNAKVCLSGHADVMVRASPVEI